MPKIILHQGDNREVLKTYPNNHFDSCVCDPPYELGFMGKAWDKTGIAYEVAMWQEVFRVLKPGAHLLAFGGSRTYHRLAGAIEDAGFQIRDQIMWLYGTGFPKTLNVSKAIDRTAGAVRTETIWIDRYKDGKTRQNLGPVGNFWPNANGNEATVPATALARLWEGWGTALKPAHEPIVVARKPLEGTVVQNVLKHGCGGINVKGCLIPVQPGDIGSRIDGPGVKPGSRIWCRDDGSCRAPRNYQEPDGRWPANVIHDGSEEVLAEFAKYGDRPSGPAGIKKESGKDRQGHRSVFGEESRKSGTWQPGYADTGSAARFFYCAKASPEERNRGCEGLPDKPSTTFGEFAGTPDHAPRGENTLRKNNHPTVKPLALMAYLVRLVTPPGGLVLDPFCGSGSTLIAAAKEGFDAVGIDLEMENCEITERRCRSHLGMLCEVKRGFGG